MSSTLEFYFDFGSPTAYIAHQRLRQLQKMYDLEIVYRPILLGGIFKATGNSSPVMVPAKGNYMMATDLPRFLRRYGVVMHPNPHFPINTLTLMRGAFAAQELDCFDAYTIAVYDAVWVGEQNMNEEAVVRQTLGNAGLDADRLLAMTQQPAIKNRLIEATEAAVARGVFGAPTLFMDGEMYFGQDRLDFVEEALQG
jgi:2-hydroxychromene-2-carboxylate isomerase